MMPWPWDVLQTTDDALMARQYMPRRLRLDPLLMAWHPTLREPEWNRIRVLRPAPDLETQLQNALARLETFGGGCVISEPSTPPDTLEHVRQPTWRRRFRHAWVLYGLDSESVPNTLPNALHIDDVSHGDGPHFRQLFHLGFGLSDLAPKIRSTWDRALQAIQQQDTHQACDEYGVTQLRHSMARWRGEPAGIATYGIRGKVAGFYNLTVHPRFRNRGIGAHLTDYRRRRARELGAEVGFLQTQDDSVLQWHLRRGAQRGPVVEGWGPPPPPASPALG